MTKLVYDQYLYNNTYNYVNHKYVIQNTIVMSYKQWNTI